MTTDKTVARITARIQAMHDEAHANAETASRDMQAAGPDGDESYRADYVAHRAEEDILHTLLTWLHEGGDATEEELAAMRTLGLEPDDDFADEHYFKWCLRAYRLGRERWIDPGRDA